MSLLTICQGVARAIKIEVPSSIIGNTGEEPQMLLQCANDEGEALARRPTGGWIVMQKENDFTVVATGATSATAANSGPNGVAQLTGLASTAFLNANPTAFGVSGTGLPYNCFVVSVDSPTQVTLNQPASIVGPHPDYIFGQFAYTVPADFERPIDNTMWDRSRYWQMRGPLSPQQWQFYKSSIYSRATIQRRFRFKKVGTVITLSIDPVPTDTGSQLVYEYVSNGWCQSSAGVPQSQWLADTDVGVLDEYLIRLGVKWRALDRLGLDYSSALDDYERGVAKAIAQDGGSPILDMAPGQVPFLISSAGIQDGNFPGT